MIALAASAAVSGLLRAGAGRERLAGEALHVPRVLDTEVVEVIRKLVLRRTITAKEQA